MTLSSAPEETTAGQDSTKCRQKLDEGPPVDSQTVVIMDRASATETSKMFVLRSTDVKNPHKSSLIFECGCKARKGPNAAATATTSPPRSATADTEAHNDSSSTRWSCEARLASVRNSSRPALAKSRHC